MPYVVGVTTESPKNPRHAGAAGSANTEAFEDDANPTNHTLYGAMVAGPNDKDEFQDRRSAASFTSVRVTYNAAYQSLLAYQILHSDSDPPFANTTSSSQDMMRPPTPPWLIGLIVTLIVVFGILALAGVCYARRRKSQRQQQH